MALFGNPVPVGKRLPDFTSMMPGLIGGYGGGTFNSDGSAATPAPSITNSSGNDLGAMPQGLTLGATPPTNGGLFGAGAAKQAPAVDPAPDAAPAADGSAAPNVPQLGPSFDAKGEYDRILQQLQPPKHKPTLGHILTTAAQILGPALMAAGGNQAGANALVAQFAQQRKDAMRDRQALALQMLKWRQDEYSRTANLTADTAKPFTIGHDRVQYDPTTGQTHTIYHGPQDFEAYAQTQGLEPGTDDYNNAVQDYVLRSSGPSALDNSETLDDYRTHNRASLEGLRQRNRVSMEGLRQGNRETLRGTPTYRDTHALPGRASGGGGRGEITATGPNGQKIKLVNGQWVPVQ